MGKIRKACMPAALGLVLSLSLAQQAVAVQSPYEPNDSIFTAAGPLTINSTYKAGLETSNDVDFFYFYVTSPNTAQVQITMTALGGGVSEYPTLTAKLDNAHGDSLDYADDLSAPDFDTMSDTLRRGKYFVEVDQEGGNGQSYKFSTAGTDGAFGSYTDIQTQCATSSTNLTVARTALTKAQRRLRRAHGRRRRHARKAVVAAKASLKLATRGYNSWCTIPQ